MRHVILASFLWLAAGALAASGRVSEPGDLRTTAGPRFVPVDLYRYETVEFDNGFKAILNPREISRNVSFRLVVDVGLLDFDCRDRELPHLAEHLVFSGYDNLTESDLDAMINALGGEWNAYTHSFKTEYQLDIYSGHALEGLAILYRMFTATVVSAQRLESAAGVVHAESGGRPGLIRDLLYQWGFGEGAVGDSYRRFVPDSRTFCPRVPVTDHIGVAEVEAFLRADYHPGAMLLIAVGDFDPGSLRAALDGSFGAMPPAGSGRPVRPERALEPRPVEYQTTLNPLIGNSTHVTIDLFAGSPAPLSGRYFALQQLAGYLDSRLYEEIRVNRGLAYTPMVSLVDQGDFLTLLLEAEVDPTRAGEALGIMTGLIDEVRRNGIDAATLAAQRQGSLYQLAAQLDRNASFSGIYVDVSERLARGEPVPDIQAAITAYDAGALGVLARQYLVMDRALVYQAAPTLTYRALGWLLALASVLLAAGLWRAFARRRARARDLAGARAPVSAVADR